MSLPKIRYPNKILYDFRLRMMATLPSDDWTEESWDIFLKWNRQCFFFLLRLLIRQRAAPMSCKDEVRCVLWVDVQSMFILYLYSWTASYHEYKWITHRGKHSCSRIITEFQMLIAVGISGLRLVNDRSSDRSTASRCWESVSPINW